MSKVKSVMAGIGWRGQWDIIRDGGNDQELEGEVKEDVMVDGGEMPKFELGDLQAKPFKDSSVVTPGVQSLKDLKDPLSLLGVSRWVQSSTGTCDTKT